MTRLRACPYCGVPQQTFSQRARERPAKSPVGVSGVGSGFSGLHCAWYGDAGLLPGDSNAVRLQGGEAASSGEPRIHREIPRSSYSSVRTRTMRRHYCANATRGILVGLPNCRLAQIVKRYQ